MGDNAAVFHAGETMPATVGSEMSAIPNPLAAGMVIQSSRSDELNHFLPAFLAAKKQQLVATKNMSNVVLASKYADLAEVLRVVEESAHENGLVGIATCVQAAGLFGIDYRLYHAESSQFYGCQVLLPMIEMTDPQVLGSLRTYAHRYAVVTLFSVRVKDDDDGNLASGIIQGAKQVHERTKAIAAESSAPAPKPATDSQRALIERLMTEKKAEMEPGVLDDTKKASAFIDKLKALPIPTLPVAVTEIRDPENVAKEAAIAEGKEPVAEVPGTREPERSETFKSLKAKWTKRCTTEKLAGERMTYLNRMQRTKMLLDGEFAILKADHCVLVTE